MGANTLISWADHTFNPWIGCTKVSLGCAHCYAAAYGHRFGVRWGPSRPRRRTSDANWRLPLRWNKQAENSGIRPRVFCASLADWLDDEVPPEWLRDLLSLAAQTPCLDWLLLTKRPQNWRHHLEVLSNYEIAGLRGLGILMAILWLGGQAPTNVWVGVTAEDQARLNERLPLLLQIPARVRFLSCEPLLEPVNLTPGEPVSIVSPIYSPAPQPLHWVICGGESGPDARYMHPLWARSLLDQCRAGHVAFWMKQLGGHPNALHELTDFPEDLRVRELPR